MLPSQATFKRGKKDSQDIISQEKPLEIGNKIWMHNPNRNKFLGWALSQGKREPTTNRIFGHLEDTPFPNWVEFAGTDESSQATGGLVLGSGQGARVTIGSKIFWPRTGQIIRLAETMSTDTTQDVNRNWGRGVSTDYLLKGDKGLILPPNFPEGFTTGAALSNAMKFKSFNCSEISYPVEVTNVENAERSRGGNPFERALSKVLKQVKEQQEAELLYSGQKTDNSNFDHPIGSADGIDNYISTHSYSASSLSRMDFFDIMTEWLSTNPEGGAIITSLAFKALITEWALQITQYTIPVIGSKTGGSLGLEIDQIVMQNGKKIDIIDVDLMNQEPYLMGSFFCVPKGRIHYRPLIHYENLEPRYLPIKQDEIHSRKGEVYGVYGWEFFEEEMWAKFSGLTLAA